MERTSELVLQGRNRKEIGGVKFWTMLGFLRKGPIGAFHVLSKLLWRTDASFNSFLGACGLDGLLKQERAEPLAARARW